MASEAAIIGHYRALRRFSRRTLLRIGVLRANRPSHRPVFTNTALALRCGLKRADLDAGVDLHDLQREGARRARVLFGPRFFVDPAAVETLSGRLLHEFPELHRALMHRVELDRTEGIPVYSTVGPVLGPGFPWTELPPGPGGDALYVKRPHRFAFAPRHALACLYDPTAAIALDGMLRSWMSTVAGARFSYAYDSNLAVIQRILALSWAWVFLAGRPEQDDATGLLLEWQLLQIIEADIRFLEPRLGGSTPNNHLLADRFAAWYLQTLFPELLDAVDPGAQARWCVELLRQTYDDGGSFEHSSHYHEFAAEMSAAYVLLAERNGLPPDDRVYARLQAILAYQCDLAGRWNRPQPLGNAIEDTLFPLDAGESWASGSLREIYRALFCAQMSPAPGTDNSILRSFWLLGGRLVRAGAEPAPALPAVADPPLIRYRQAGLYIMDDPALATRMLFRTGPVADAPIAAGHMHADLLAVYVEVDGIPVIVDAGTYTYRRNSDSWGVQAPDWRGYFAGPAAHNALTCSGADPLGTMAADFRPRHIDTRVASRCATGTAVSLVEAVLDAPNVYNRMRRLCVHIAGEYWLLLHRLPQSEAPPDQAWLGLQCAPLVEQRLNGRRVSSRFAGQRRTLTIVSGERDAEPCVLYASTDPIGGWVSNAYGRMEAAPQLRYPVVDWASLMPVLLTTNSRHGTAEIIRSDYREEGKWLVTLYSMGITDWILVQSLGGSGWEDREVNIGFDGKLLWLRTYPDASRELHWLEATRLDWPQESIDILVSSDEAGDLVLSDLSRSSDLEKQFVRFQW